MSFNRPWTSEHQNPHKTCGISPLTQRFAVGHSFDFCWGAIVDHLPACYKPQEVAGSASCYFCRFFAQPFDPRVPLGDVAQSVASQSFCSVRVVTPTAAASCSRQARQARTPDTHPHPSKSLELRKARLAGSRSGCLLLYMWHLWLALITS